MLRGSELKIVCITAPPGAGKSTIISRLLEERADLRMFAGQSYTTREPRSGDVDGEYKHVKVQDFIKMQQRKEFAWFFPHGEYWVGTRYVDILRAFDPSTLYISVMTLVPEAVGIVQFIAQQQGQRILSFFIETPESERLARMIGRGDEPTQAEKRAKETATWDRDYMLELDVKPVYIPNLTEKIPGEKALQRILRIIEVRK